MNQIRNDELPCVETTHLAFRPTNQPAEFERVAPEPQDVGIARRLRRIQCHPEVSIIRAESQAVCEAGRDLVDHSILPRGRVHQVQACVAIFVGNERHAFAIVADRDACDIPGDGGCHDFRFDPASKDCHASWLNSLP